MNTQAVLAQLEQSYPGAPVKLLPEVAPKEIVCEFDPKSAHPDWSLAVAIIDKSEPHYHQHTVEIYRVLKGELKLHVDHEEFVMYEGQEFTITPGRIHWAEGNETWVEVYCSPGYDPDDHLMAE